MRIITIQVTNISVYRYKQSTTMASDSEKKASVREDQLVFMRGVVAGSVFLLLVALLAVYGPIPRPHLPSLEDKLVFTLQWQAVSAFALIAGKDVRLFKLVT